MQAKKFPFGTPVRLKWVDSNQQMNGWEYDDPESLGGLISIDTIGYVVNSKATYLTLSSATGHKGHGVLCPVSIPWGCITELEELPSNPQKQ